MDEPTRTLLEIVILQGEKMNLMRQVLSAETTAVQIALHMDLSQHRRDEHDRYWDHKTAKKNQREHITRTSELHRQLKQIDEKLKGLYFELGSYAV